MKNILGIILLIYAGACQAIPVEWTLQGVEFDDNGTASGSFLYDSDTNAFSDISIVTAGGWSDVPGGSYSEVCLGGYSCSATTVVFDLSADDSTFVNAFGINLASVMTNAGGTIAILIGPDCTFSCEFGEQFGVVRGVSTGSISTVPIPTAVWLFGSGLGLLGWFRN